MRRGSPRPASDRSSRQVPLAARRLSARLGVKVDDAVHIEGLEVFAHVGVPDEERSASQRLTFRLTFWPGRPFSELNDEIGKAVNYADVCAEVKKFVEARRDRLIETLASALAQRLLGAFEIRKITVELRKYILPETEFVSVTVTRERSSK
jgi:7,8-dihydroneopterin aldolase/epimerase/oxygenase